MKKLFIILFLIIFSNLPVWAEEISGQTDDIVSVYSKDNINFGLKNSKGNITEPLYKKLIRLSDYSWIVQYRSKFGILNANGEYLVKPKYRHAERCFGKYAKLGNDNDYGIYDADGNVVVPPIFSRIDTLYGKMFLTYRKYKYGIYGMDGVELLPNQFDDIYMPTFKVVRVKYKGEWFEIQRKDKDKIELPENAMNVVINNQEYTITHIVVNTGLWSGYSALTATDYIVKIISSISPAYEDTIDDLMLSHGTDTVSIFMQLSWLPKFPIAYIQRYYRNFVTPNNGPLSEVRESMKKQIK